MAKFYTDKYGTRRMVGQNPNVYRGFVRSTGHSECHECAGIGGHTPRCPKAN